MIPIPAIDLMNGNCVRLSQGDYDRQTTYETDPVAMAKAFEEAGCTWLHLVDLEGARARTVKHIEVLRSILSATDLKVEFGGGITDRAAAESVLEAGASRIIVGSLAVRNPGEVAAWIKRFGTERIVLGADLKNGKIAVNGWEETSNQDWSSFLRFFRDAGIKYVLCTDVARDGMLDGPAVDLYREILGAYPDLALLASGGVRNMADLEELRRIGCHGAIVGKALYEQRITPQELKSFTC